MLAKPQVRCATVGRAQAVYIHCSGGHGRAGTVAACLLGALVPELTADESLAMTKAYHDTRHGLGHAEHNSPGA